MSEPETPIQPPPEPSLTDIAGFFGGLLALKFLKQGMDNGNLPKIMERYGAYIVKLMIQNPESVVYAAAMFLGFNAFPQNLSSRLAGAGTGATGVMLAKSGNLLSAGAGLSILGILGLCNVPSEVIESMYESTLKPGRFADWWPFKTPENWPKYR